MSTRVPGGTGRFTACGPTIPTVQQLEFTIEPFVEGHPGPRHGGGRRRHGGRCRVEFGPFGVDVLPDDELMPIVAA